MSNRTVIVASTVSSVAKKIENFNGSSLADLKANSVFRSLYKDGVDIILSPGNVTLVLDDAQLPDTDFKIFLIATKNKSGLGTSEAYALGQRVAEAIGKAASQASEEEFAYLEKELIGAVEDVFGVNLSKDCAECDSALEEAKKLQSR